MSSISIEELSMNFNSNAVLSDIILNVHDGEFFVLVGPSGSGKSTLLRLIAGLLKPHSGCIRFNDRNVDSLSARERNVAMVFQNYALYPHKNVFDNIAFGLRAHRVPEGEVKKRVQEAAEMLSISGLLTRWPKELSGGERQRVAIGRAIVRNPEVYLLDEPLSNLDAKLRIEMRDELSKLQKGLNATFIYVTHDQIEAMTLGERIAVINKGKIEQVGTPEDLYDYPNNKFVAGFIGAPSMNFIEGRIFYDEQESCLFLKRDKGKIPIIGVPADVLGEWITEEVILGFRPESVIFDQSDTPSVRVHVQRVEPIGHEGFVYLDFCGARVISRIQQWKKYRDAKIAMAAIRFKDIYLFDIEDGSAIVSRGRLANVP